jgi:hypothetical protein
MAANLQCGDKIDGVKPASGEAQGFLINSPIAATVLTGFLASANSWRFLHPRPFQAVMMSWLPSEYGVSGLVNYVESVGALALGIAFLISGAGWATGNRLEMTFWRFCGGFMILSIFVHRIPLRFQLSLHELLVLGELLFLCMSAVIAAMAWQKKWKTRGSEEAAQDVSR